MRTVTVELEDHVVDRLTGLANVRSVTVEHLLVESAESLADELQQKNDYRRHFSPDQIAAIEAGLADARAGRTVSNKEMFAELRAKYGW